MDPRVASRQNKPYDKLVRELLTSRGSSYEHPAANFFRVTREAKPTMEKTTQVFLGVRMVCAQCHDHPFERWTQNQYYEMAAFFSAVGCAPGMKSAKRSSSISAQDYEMKHPKDGRVDEAELPGAGDVASDAGAIPTDAQRRAGSGGLADLEGQSVLCQVDGQSRVELLLRRGIIDPVMTSARRIRRAIPRCSMR